MVEAPACSGCPPRVRPHLAPPKAKAETRRRREPAFFAHGLHRLPFRCRLELLPTPSRLALADLLRVGELYGGANVLRPRRRPPFRLRPLAAARSPPSSTLVWQLIPHLQIYPRWRCTFVIGQRPHHVSSVHPASTPPPIGSAPFSCCLRFFFFLFTHMLFSQGSKSWIIVVRPAAAAAILDGGKQRGRDLRGALRHAGSGKELGLWGQPGRGKRAGRLGGQMGAEQRSASPCINSFGSNSESNSTNDWKN
uniref:Uncharacterized protein n=1 Tax=Oryza barthii TaxID=65489 RepID=A0A0D3HC54_9ORYZ